MSRTLSPPENTLLFGGSGKYISKVSVMLPPVMLRTAQILGGSEVHALPIGPRGPHHHPKWGSGPRGTEQVQGREGVVANRRTFNPRTGAKRGADEQGY